MTREPTEPPLWRVRAHYRWAQPCGRWEWFSTWWIPTPIWRVWHHATHPREYLAVWRRNRQCPPVGGYVMYHDEGPYKIVNRVGDDLVLEFPHGNATVSWLNCCWLPSEKPVHHGVDA